MSESNASNAGKAQTNHSWSEGKRTCRLATGRRASEKCSPWQAQLHYKHWPPTGRKKKNVVCSSIWKSMYSDPQQWLHHSALQFLQSLVPRSLLIASGEKHQAHISLGHDLASRRCFDMDCRRNKSHPFGLSSSILKWKPIMAFCTLWMRKPNLFFFLQNYGSKLILPLRHWKENLYCKIMISIVIAWITVKRYVNLYLNSPINCHINKETSEKSSCVILEKNCSK